MPEAFDAQPDHFHELYRHTDDLDLNWEIRVSRVLSAGSTVILGAGVVIAATDGGPTFMDGVMEQDPVKIIGGSISLALSTAMGWTGIKGIRAFGNLARQASQERLMRKGRNQLNHEVIE